MKKRYLRILAIILALVMSLGVLAACQDDESDVTIDPSPVSEVGGEDETQETTYSYDTDANSDSDEMHSEEEPDRQSVCAIDPDAPHPFATALREQIASYDGVVRAYIATLDDDGTMGVLTIRSADRVFYDDVSGRYFYLPIWTLFYMQSGDLFQMDLSGYGRLFVSGRYNRLMARVYAHTQIVEFIYKLESGRLEISTQLNYFSDEYLSYLTDDEVAAELIAERDARAEYARVKYGLAALPPPAFGHKPNPEHHTAQILALTMSCDLLSIIQSPIGK